MAPGLRRAANRRLPPLAPSTNLGPQAAGSTVSVPKYPGGLDSATTFEDDKTILSAIWTNYLGRMIEAIEAEVGPIGQPNLPESSWIAGNANLRDLLDDLTFASNSFKAGAIVGIYRFTLKKAAASFGALASVTLNVGKKPVGAQPIFFGTMFQGLLGNATFLPGAATVRGYCAWTGPTSIALTYRGMALGAANPGAGGAPAGSYIAEMDGVVIFVPLGNPAR